jgi:hypothetical protein
LPEHHFGTIEANRLDPDADLPLLRDRRGQFVELKHVGSSGLMESYDLWHVGTLPRLQCPKRKNTMRRALLNEASPFDERKPGFENLRNYEM